MKYKSIIIYANINETFYNDDVHISFSSLFHILKGFL